MLIKDITPGSAYILESDHVLGRGRVYYCLANIIEKDKGKMYSTLTWYIVNNNNCRIGIETCSASAIAATGWCLL